MARFIDAIDQLTEAVVATYTENDNAVTTWDVPTIFPSLDDGNYTFRVRSSETGAYEVTSGTVFTEDWSAYSVGDTITELGADYTNYQISPTIVADATAPSGLACTNGATTNAHRWIKRTDIETALTAGGWTTVEVLFATRGESTSFARAGLGFSASVGVFTGVATQRTSGGHRYWIATESDPNGIGTAIVFDRPDGALTWIRYQVEGDTIRARGWADGDAEPETWITEVHTGPLDFLHAGMMNRIGNPTLSFLFYGVGIDAAVPMPT